MLARGMPEGTIKKKYSPNDNFLYNLIEQVQSKIEEQMVVVKEKIDTLIENKEYAATVWTSFQKIIEERIKLEEEKEYSLMMGYDVRVIMKVLERILGDLKGNYYNEKFIEERIEKRREEIITREEKQKREEKIVFLMIKGYINDNEQYHLVKDMMKYMIGLKSQYKVAEMTLKFVGEQEKAVGKITDMIMLKRINILLGYNYLDESRMKIEKKNM